MIGSLFLGILLGVLAILISCEVEKNYEDKKKAKEE